MIYQKPVTEHSTPSPARGVRIADRVPDERRWGFAAELLAMVRGLAALLAVLHDPVYRTLVIRVAVLFTTGTIFYSLHEGWSVLDALWFSVATLLTASFADLFPTTAVSKIFTIMYAIVGVGVLVSFVSAVGRRTAERWLQRAQSHAAHSTKE